MYSMRFVRSRVVGWQVHFELVEWSLDAGQIRDAKGRWLLALLGLLSTLTLFGSATPAHAEQRDGNMLIVDCAVVIRIAELLQTILTTKGQTLQRQNIALE